MNLLPAGLFARLRLAVLSLAALSLAWVAYGNAWLVLRAYDPHDGDIVFQSLPNPPGRDLVDAIEGCTRSPLSHTGIVLRDDGHWVVYEAIGPSKKTPLYDWIRRGRGSALLVHRLKQERPDAMPALQRTLEGLMGRDYDTRYEPGDDALYCSELVFKAYERAAGLKLGTWQTLGTLDWKPWTDIIQRYNDGNAPLDRWMITSVEITRSPLLKQVYATPGFRPEA